MKKYFGFSKLRYMTGKSFEVYYGQASQIGIENGEFRIKKSHGSYKDFGKSIHEVWAEAFLNYQNILVSFFGKSSPDLHDALHEFYLRILELAKVYDWQRAVLPLAINVHTHISTKQPSDPAVWTIPEVFQSRFCNASTTLSGFTTGSASTTSNASKRKRETSDPGSKPARTSGAATNNASVICEGLNSSQGCKFGTCARSHECKGCGSKGQKEESISRSLRC